VKFLIDAQLPYSLCVLLRSKGIDAIHTFELPKQNRTPDYEIIEISINQNRVVVTKDRDFLESYLLKNLPPKLIIVKTGNISNSHLLKIFDENIQKLTELLFDNSLIEISKEEIVIHN
jgi:predicted nuclease of predicted toxin-antitoxin system